jgi:hypothetical protein
MNQPKPHPQLERWLGYFAMPHELLHVLGYRLVGQRCEYRRGQRSVTPLGPMRRSERLVGLLFPFTVLATLCLIFGLLSGLAYREVLRSGSWVGFAVWSVLSLLSGSYAGTAIGDLRQAYLLIFDKPWDSWTPFDLFFWPVIDWAEIRKRERMKHHDPSR